MERKTILLIFISSFFCFPAGATTVEDVMDGGLETWTSSSNLTHWTEESSTPSKYGSSGDYYAKMYGNGAIYQYLDCSMTPGLAQINLNAGARKVSNNEYMLLRTAFYDASDNVLDSTSTTLPVTSTTWGNFVHSSVIPEDTDHIQILIKCVYSSAVSQIYIDDISVSVQELEAFSTFSVRNETNISEPLYNITTLIYNDTYSFQYNSASSSITLSNMTIADGIYNVKYSVDNFYPRWYKVTIPSNNTAYLPSYNESVSLVSFSLIDYTGDFTYTTSKLKITKPASSGTITISSSGFAASGLSQHYLIQNEPYFLELVTDEYTRGVGVYIPAGNDEVSLVIGSISIVPSQTTYGGFNYALTKTNETVTMNWTAPSGSLNEDFNFSIYDSNNTLVYTTSSSTPNGTATYIYANPDEQYRIVLSANTTGGILQHSEYVTGETNLIDLQVSEIWYTMIGLFFIIIVGLCFGYKHASAGAFITATFAAGLTAIGFLNISALIIALVMILGLLAIFRGRGA